MLPFKSFRLMIVVFINTVCDTLSLHNSMGETLCHSEKDQLVTIPDNLFVVSTEDIFSTA